MDLIKQNALYELIKKVVIECFSEYDHAILAEYEGQVLNHILIFERDILSKCRCKRYINEYRKYASLNPNDLKEAVNKLCEEKILFRVKSIEYANPEPVNGYALNRKYAKPIYSDIDEKNQKIYMEKILKHNLMPVFDDLNKLTLEEKLKHRIVFETLSTNVILALMFYDIYTYYDLVTMRQFRLFNFYYGKKHIGELQKHLNLLGLKFDMYELNGKVKIEEDKRINKIINTLESIHERNEYSPEIMYFGNNIFIYKDNNSNFVNRFKAGIKYFDLAKYFELGLFKPSKIDNRYFYQVHLNYIKIQDDFPYEEINTLLKLIK